MDESPKEKQKDEPNFDDAMKILDDYYEGTPPIKPHALQCGCCGGSEEVPAEEEEEPKAKTKAKKATEKKKGRRRGDGS